MESTGHDGLHLIYFHFLKRSMKPRKLNISATNTPPTSANEPGSDAAEHEVDTLRLVALQHNDELALEDSGRHAAAVPFDPYNKDVLKPVHAKPRKSIDDLRKLSAEIAKTKIYNPKHKGTR